MSKIEINEARLEVLERLTLAGDKQFVSGALKELSHGEMLAYLRTMKQDFDRLHDLDSNFPELIIYGHNPLPSRGPTDARIFTHRLNDINPADDKIQIDSIQTRREVSGTERLFSSQFWENPFEVRNLYDPSIPKLREQNKNGN